MPVSQCLSNVGLSDIITWNNLRKNLALKSYEFKKTLKLNFMGPSQWSAFFYWITEQSADFSPNKKYFFLYTMNW